MLVEICTAVGSMAGVGSLFLGWRQHRKSKSSKKTPTGLNVDELPDERAFVDSQVRAIDAGVIAVGLCLHTVHSSAANWKAQRVNAALAAAKKRGLTVRVIAGTGEAQFLGAHELQELHNVDVRLNPELLHSDLRFLKVDANETLIGIADKVRNDSEYSPSHSWAVLNTTTLADALEREFQRLWLSPASRDLFEFCMEHIGPLRDRIPAAKLAADLGLKDVLFVSQLYQRPAFATATGNRAFIFHGKAGSGKSTLMRHLWRRFGGHRLDLEDFVLPLVFRYGNENVVGSRVKEMYQEVVNHSEQVPHDLIETGSDLVGSVLPPLFQSIRRHGKTPVVVHCDVALGEAQRRNAARARPVPIEVLQAQDEEEGRGTFRQVCADAKVQLIEVSTQQGISTTVDRLASAVGQVSVA